MLPMKVKEMSTVSSQNNCNRTSDSDFFFLYQAVKQRNKTPKRSASEFPFKSTIKLVGLLIATIAASFK